MRWFKAVGGTLGLMLLTLVVTGCGGGGGVSSPQVQAGMGWIVGRVALEGAPTSEGVQVVAEQVLQGKTATVRTLIASQDNPTRLRELVEEVQSGRFIGRGPVDGLYSTTTDASGNYRLEVPEGEYWVAVRKESYFAHQLSVQVRAGQTVRVDFLTRQARVGTVQGEVRLSNEEFNSGILVFISGTSLLAYTQGTIGSYSIPNVPVQSSGDQPYFLLASAAGYGEDGIHLPKLLLNAGETVTAPLIVLSPGITITGRVVSEANPLTPVPGVQVSTSSGQSATTDSQGNFVLRRVPMGEVELLFTKAGFEPLRQRVFPSLGSFHMGDVVLPVEDNVTTISADTTLADDTVWKRDKVLLGTVTVPAGRTLTVRPGVMVRVAAGKGIVVQGTLRAEGEWTVTPSLPPPSRAARSPFLERMRALAQKHRSRQGPQPPEGEPERPIFFTSNSLSPAPGDWAGIRFEPGSQGFLKIVGIEFAGPGITCNGASLTMELCGLWRNKATVDGGALRAINSSWLTLRSVFLEENESTLMGGALFVEGSFLEWRGGDALRNRAGSHGGAIAVSNSRGEIREYRIAENRILGADPNLSGGGLVCSNSTLRIEDGEISDNVSPGSGGGLAAFGGNLQCSRFRVIGNRAKWGGGISVGDRALGRIEDVTLQHNAAEDSGGGLFITSSGITASNNFISDNKAASGSGVAVDNASPLLERNVVAVNVGESAVKIFGSSASPTLLNNTIARNHGMGLTVLGGAAPTVKNTIIAFNAGTVAGFFAASGTNPTVTFNDIFGNRPKNVNTSEDNPLDEVNGAIGPGTYANNISQDPLFGYGRDFYLQPFSPCIKAGEGNVDMGAFPFRGELYPPTR